jgi:hypothetical protein
MLEQSESFRCKGHDPAIDVREENALLCLDATRDGVIEKRKELDRPQRRKCALMREAAHNVDRVANIVTNKYPLKTSTH